LGEFFIEFGFNIILKKSNNKVIKNTRNYKYVRLAVHVNGVISEIIRAKEFGFHNFNQYVYVSIFDQNLHPKNNRATPLITTYLHNIHRNLTTF